MKSWPSEIPGMLGFGVFNSTLLLNAALLFQEVVCAFYFILFFFQDLLLHAAFGRKKCLSACFSSEKLL